MDTRRINISFEAVLVMILMILFAVSSCIMIIEGSKSFDSIIDKKDKQEHVRVAVAYLNMRIKQNDVSGNIELMENYVEGQDTLAIYHTGEEEGYVTFIYWYQGILYECYTDTLTTPTLDTSEKVTELDSFQVTFDPSTQTVRCEITYDIGNKTMVVEPLFYIRSSTI